MKPRSMQWPCIDNKRWRRLRRTRASYKMFPIDFPLECLRSARKGEWVIDPFCGRGSTNYAARLLGLPSIGIDSNPVAAAIAQAKLVVTTPERIVQVCRRILE